MLTNLDPQSALFVSEVDRVQNRIAIANNQVTSGRKITSGLRRSRPNQHACCNCGPLSSTMRRSKRISPSPKETPIRPIPH